MAVFGAVAVMLVAGWQFGVSGTETVFSESEVALENAIAGSGDSIICYSILQGTDGQSVACSPCSLATGIPPWYHFGDQCTP